MSTEALTRSLAALEAWLAKHKPLDASLAPPAAPDLVAEAEAAYELTFSDEYRAFLARHDGQVFVPEEDGEGGTLAPLFNGFDLLPVQLAAAEYETILEEWGDEGPGEIVAHGPVRPLYKHDKWWPVTCVFGASQYHCIDLDPAPGGTVGQVIFVADDDENRRVIAPSLSAFLDMVVATLGVPGVQASEEGIDLPDDAFDSLLGVR